MTIGFGLASEARRTSPGSRAIWGCCPRASGSDHACPAHVDGPLEGTRRKRPGQRHEARVLVADGRGGVAAPVQFVAVRLPERGEGRQRAARRKARYCHVGAKQDRSDHRAIGSGADRRRLLLLEDRERPLGSQDATRSSSPRAITWASSRSGRWPLRISIRAAIQGAGCAGTGRWRAMSHGTLVDTFRCLEVTHLELPPKAYAKSARM